MKRLFVSIPVSNEIRKKLDEYIAPLKEKYDFKWVKAENYHITLFFIGDVSDNEIPEISNILRAIASGYRKFNIKPDHIQFYPGKRPRNIWLIYKDNLDLIDLSKKIFTHMDQYTEKKSLEPLKFKAHTTIARLKPSGKFTNERLPALILDDMEVDKIELMESTLMESGAVYATLESFNLNSDAI